MLIRSILRRIKFSRAKIERINTVARHVLLHTQNFIKFITTEWPIFYKRIYNFVYFSLHKDTDNLVLYVKI